MKNPETKGTLAGWGKNPGRVSTTQRVVHTSAKRHSEKKGRNSRRRRRQYSEKLRNGTPEERKRERVYQEELKRNGELVNDTMERRRGV